jgi:hypothetical protein
MSSAKQKIGRAKRNATPAIPAPDSELTTYTVRHRIDHDGVIYLPGDTIAMGALAAAAARQAGAIETPIETPTEEPAEQP